jgi:hypothetical protein
MDELDRLLPLLWDQMNISALMRGRGGIREHWKRIPGKARFAGRGGLQETYGKSQFASARYHGSGNLSLPRFKFFGAARASFNGQLTINIATRSWSQTNKTLQGAGTERVNAKQQMLLREVASGTGTVSGYLSRLALISAAMSGTGGSIQGCIVFVPFGSAAFAGVGSLVASSAKYKKTSTLLVGNSTLSINSSQYKSAGTRLAGNSTLRLNAVIV